MLKVSRDRSRKLRQLVLDNYGRVCACCGEVTEQFLSIDHMNNDGAVHRKLIKGLNGGSIYFWLKREGFPSGFQTLCYNCNFAKGRYGVCPHETARALERLNAGDVQQNLESMPGTVINVVPMPLSIQGVEGTGREFSKYN